MHELARLVSVTRTMTRKPPVFTLTASSVFHAKQLACMSVVHESMPL